MARFRHPFKLAGISKEELESAIKLMKSQRRVAELFGVTQMTISRRMKFFGIVYDGRSEANKEPDRAEKQSIVMKAKYSSGELTPFWKNKKFPPEVVEKRISKIRGKPAWNSGRGRKFSIICLGCGNEFVAPKESRKVCSKECSSKYMSNLYSDGRLFGSNNPNYGNDKVKIAWKEGRFDERSIPNHGRGIGGHHNGIWMRSSWELEFAKNLDDKGIIWEYEPKRFKLSSGKSYVPDFYIPKLKLWIEIKGHWYENAKQKFALFLTEYPGENIIVISEKPLWHHMLNG